MRPLFRSSLFASYFACLPALLASLAAGETLDLLGSSPSLPDSLASLGLDLDNETVTWSSSDPELGAIEFGPISPGLWIRTGDSLTFQYTDGQGRLFLGASLLSAPGRTVVDVSDGSSQVRYLFKIAPGAPPAASLSDLTISEEEGVANVTIQLDTETLQPGSVEFSCAPGTASEADFACAGGRIEIPAGRREATISIPIVNDLRVERVEEFIVTLANPVRLTLGQATATVRIEDVDTTEVSVFDAQVDEDARGARIPIRFSAPSDFTTVVVHQTVSGTAIAQEDFRPRTNDTTFTPGQQEFLLFVPPINDDETEGAETFPCRVTSVDGERVSIGRAEGTVTIFDDESPKVPRVDEIGWQWPNNAVYRPELEFEDYLMSDGELVAAVNFGHGSPGSTLAVEGIDFQNTGEGVGNPSGAGGGISYEVTGAPNADDGLGFPGIDNLSFSQLSGPDARLRIFNLDPEKQYVVQLFFGEPRAIDARRWMIDTDLGFSGDVGGPGEDYVRRQFGQGPLGDGIAGQDPPARPDRRIISFGLCNREEFTFQNQGWNGKAGSFSAFQVREVEDYPLSPDVHTPERVGGLEWTGSQLIAVTDEGGILTGTETLQFTAQESGNREILTDVIEVDGTLLVVGNRGTIITSTDGGVTWTKQVSNAAVQLWGAPDIGSRVVVLGDDGVIVTSTDLVTWTPRDSGTNLLLGNGVWNGSLLVVVGDRGVVLNSADGIDYTAFQLPGLERVNLNGVVWDGSRFLASAGDRVLFGDGFIYTSPDGANWTKSDFEARAPLTSFIFNGSVYLVGDRAGSIYRSTDGDNWSEVIPVPNDGITSMVWTGSRFIVGARNGDIMWSVDGVDWSSETGVALPAPLLTGDTYAAWAAQQGLQAQSPNSDLNGDGFANLFHYALGISARKTIAPTVPGLLPSIDTEASPGRPTPAYHLPASLPSDLRIDVEQSTDGKTWTIIASRVGSAGWSTAPGHAAVERDSVGGYRLTEFPTAAGPAQPVSLYRLRVSLIP